MQEEPQVIGVIEVQNPIGREELSPAEKQFLASIASHLAVQMEGALPFTKVLE